MTSTLIDTNVLLDVIENRPIWSAWAAKHLERLSEEGDLLINQIVYAEASVPYETIEDFELVVRTGLLEREDLPWSAGFVAAKAHKQFRARGGTRVSTLPDFLIAAHAQVKGHRLITRDASRYRTYFPEVEVIAPDTHP
jgi:predicted nucleic acid-binding protein